ncbi:MAG: hypothetical protein ACYC05_03495 [Sulfuricella sp.]|nr:hypothetical protein [Gammaproteobacteria bacterium]
MKKVLVAIQRKTLIPHYQVKTGPVRNGSGRETGVQITQVYDETDYAIAS